MIGDMQRFVLKADFNTLFYCVRDWRRMYEVMCAGNLTGRRKCVIRCHIDRCLFRGPIGNPVMKFKSVFVLV